MKWFAPPDALRAARALSRLSQQELCKKIQVSRQSVSAAEKDASAPFPTISKMRTFYEELGLRFLGTIDIDTGAITAAGVCWRYPGEFPPSDAHAEYYHTEANGTAFVAARSLLNASRIEVSKSSGISLKELAAVEVGTQVASSAYRSLRLYYGETGIEFMGAGDVRTGLYYGVGVRWRSAADH